MKIKNKTSEGHELLEHFCSNSDKRLATPFIVDGWACASDGEMMVRIPSKDVKNVVREVPFESILTMEFFPDADGKWQELPEYSIPKKIKCRTCLGTKKVSACFECGGDGVVVFENEYNMYEFECGSCRGRAFVPGEGGKCGSCSGTGEIYGSDPKPILINNIGLNPSLLEKINGLPGVKLFFSKKALKYHFFKFDGGHGILMPMAM